MRSFLRLLGSGIVLSLLFVVSANAQAIQTGGISGVVTDQSGGLVKGATVEIVSEGTGKAVRNLITGDDGAYSTNLLPPGLYRVEVTANNFKKAVVAAVQVRITELTRQDVSLQAGRIEETVNVEASPSLINPSSATTGQAFGFTQLSVSVVAFRRNRRGADRCPKRRPRYCRHQRQWTANQQ
jgi:hypothetical protein